MNILSKMTMKDNPKAIIQWCEAEIAEYEKLIAIIKNNISPKWRKMTKKQALDEIGDQKIQTLENDNYLRDFPGLMDAISEIFDSYLEGVIPNKKLVDTNRQKEVDWRWREGWNACVDQIRKNAGLKG